MKCDFVYCIPKISQSENSQQQTCENFRRSSTSFRHLRFISFRPVTPACAV